MSEVNPIEFRDIVGFPGYRVGSDGTVWTCKVCGGNNSGQLTNEWRILSQHIDGQTGYSRVTLRSPNKKTVVAAVHTLVLTAFVGRRPSGMVARHFPDQNKQNNRLDNLQWGTQKANLADRVSHGTVNSGSRNGRAKYTIEHVRKIRLLASQGIPRKNISNETGIKLCTINDILSGKSWSQVE